MLRPWIVRRQTQWLLDGSAAAAAVIVAYLLRFDFVLPVQWRSGMFLLAVVAFAVTPALFHMVGIYRSTWQYFSIRDLIIVALAALPLAVFFACTRLVTHRALVPYSIPVIWYGVAVAFWTCVRLLRRFDHEALLRATSDKRRTAILGGKSTLPGAVRQVWMFGGSHLVGLISDDLQGMQIQGHKILGPPSALANIILEHDIHMLFLSTTEIESVEDVVRTCNDLNITLKFLPSAEDVVSGNVRVSKNLTVDMLRPRLTASNAAEHLPVVECLTDRVVLVTGAGGSIGSEIVRQISAIPVKRILLLDQDENSIFEILNELGQRKIFVPIVRDVRDRDSIRDVFATERPDVVLHAAAYKHVPMMEHNPCEAVLNNVAGTRELIEAAVDFGVERFVMISTDKAVRPSSVMGATKRVAEMLIQAQAQRPPRADGRHTHFACVRFGNVLGSRGSVLPIFLKQIGAGGPVTITHEEMTRYFMTIPQAVQLVLQAATLASIGDIYMLDMGDPVKIIDFAREVIECSGLMPGKDIDIRVVGARPGEKLHEQLWSEGARVTPTPFPQVFRVHASDMNATLAGLVTRLEQTAKHRDAEGVRGLLRELTEHHEFDNPIPPVASAVSGSLV